MERFTTLPHELTWPDGPPLRLQVARFDAATFDLACFARAGLACPPAIEGSVRKRQAEFFFGRLAARDAMAAAGCDLVQVAIGPSREPLWPAGWLGSISHTGGCAAATVAPARQWAGIGIDLERVASPSAQQALRSVAFDATELDRLAAAEVDLPMATRLTLAFSAKESLYKGAYPEIGRFFGFSAARVVALDDVRRCLTLELATTLAPRYPQGRRCEVGFASIDDDLWVTAFRAG